ncbi:MAG: hypothetical protein U0Y82_01760 [Thermoleophilia bacterium]
MTRILSEHPRGWRRSHLPVLTGRRPGPVVTLGALGGPAEFARAAGLMRLGDARHRATAMTMLHHAMQAITGALIAPLAVDGVALTIAAHDLGVVLGDEERPTALWVGGYASPELLNPAAHVGHQVERLLTPVATCVRQLTGLPHRGVHRVISQTLERDCRQLSRAPRGAHPAWFGEFRAAAGLERVRWRTLEVRPDDGPPVQMDAPGTCCVLIPGGGAGGCPTCPGHPRDRQEHIAATWLSGLDDAAFHETAGRPRVDPPMSAPTAA